MSRSRKSTAAEAKLKKKEYDRKRREKLKNCPESLEKLREKERLKYLNKKEKGQVKSVSAMSSRERRQKQKLWRLNSSKYRETKKLTSNIVWKNSKVRKKFKR
ncbi:GSCOCG00012398001-RA-CDS [Cotesia congregata]|nr:GSCOCG00012398001-RA-CDS [Cotesia congregata]